VLELVSQTGKLLLLAEERDDYTLSANMYDSSQAFAEDTTFRDGDISYTLITPVKQGFYSSVLYGLEGVDIDSFVLLEKING
jgi:hypothetical protein